MSQTQSRAGRGPSGGHTEQETEQAEPWDSAARLVSLLIHSLVHSAFIANLRQDISTSIISFNPRNSLR